MPTDGRRDGRLSECDGFDFRDDLRDNFIGGNHFEGVPQGLRASALLGGAYFSLIGYVNPATSATFTQHLREKSAPQSNSTCNVPSAMLAVPSATTNALWAL